MYGEYLISVVQTAVNDGETITTEESITVDIQPNKITAVTIIPGGSLYIIVDDDDSGSSSTSEEFTENFDTTAINDIPEGFYTANGGDSTFVGVTNSGVIPYSSPNCLMFSDNHDSNYINLLRIIENQPYGQLSYFIYISEDSTWAITHIGVISLFFNTISGNNIAIRQSDYTLLNISTYSTNTWNKVTIKWDAYNFNYKILFNDVDLGTFQFVENSIPYILSFQTQGADPDQLYYLDDIALTLNPEIIED